jgi:LDH2 family malate/lactate/ureidoglycolate dehydrogenase
MTDIICTAEHLTAFSTQVLHAHGLPLKDAQTVASGLVHANLRGVDSHGVARLPIYAERLRRGLVNKNPRITIVKDSGAALLVDGNNGMGAVVTMHALDLALERLDMHGSVSIAIRHSNHYSAGSFYASKAVERNAAMWLYSNAPPTMAPWGGAQRYLGTNPYTFAAPAGTYDPIILDMATSVVARGKIILAAGRDEAIPEGWAVTADGVPTTNAQEALSGSVLPFGGPKGYGIALMIEIMSGILSGAGFGHRVGDLYEDFSKPQNVGSFMQLTRINAFMPAEEFNGRMEMLISEIKASQRAYSVNEILMPGELEARIAKHRKQEGIPLAPNTYDALQKLGDTCGVSLADVIRDT